MKKYYKVSFQHSENVYCSNIAHAETAAEEIASKEQIKKQIEEFEELAAVEKWKLERFQGWKKDPNRPENEIEWIKNEIRACKRNRLKYSMKAADLKWLLTHSV